MIKRAILNLEPFQLMVLASCETYKKETFGALFGEIVTNGGYIDYIIKLFYPYQKVKRDYTEVTLSARDNERITSLLKEIGLNFIGDYHTHTDFKGEFRYATPSPADLNWLKENSNKISIIASIKEIKNSNAVNKDVIKDKIWIIEKNTALRGEIRITHNGNNKLLYMRIQGFYFDKQDGKKRIIKIVPCGGLERLLKKEY